MIYLVEIKGVLFYNIIIYIQSSYIYIIFDGIFYLLFISYASLLVVFIKFIKLNYVRFYNTLKTLSSLEFIEASFKITM